MAHQQQAQPAGSAAEGSTLDHPTAANTASCSTFTLLGQLVMMLSISFLALPPPPCFACYLVAVFLNAPTTAGFCCLGLSELGLCLADVMRWLQTRRLSLCSTALYGTVSVLLLLMAHIGKLQI